MLPNAMNDKKENKKKIENSLMPKKELTKTCEMELSIPCFIYVIHIL